MNLSIISALCIAFGTIILYLFVGNYRRKRLPPGPRPLPLIGNLHQLPRKSTYWDAFIDWSKAYGPVVYLNLAGKDVVLLNNYDAVYDLLVKRSEVYSDREVTYVSRELISALPSNGSSVHCSTCALDLFTPEKSRALNPNATATYRSKQLSETTLLIKQILDEPNDFRAHLRRASASLVFRIAYDLPPITDSNDKDLRGIQDYANQITNSSLPGTHLVDLIPAMRCLPRFASPWKPWAENLHRRESEVLERLYNGVKKRISNGEQTSGIASKVIQGENYGLMDKECAWMIGTLFGASDTTARTTAYFIRAMLTHPDVQLRAQSELDRIVGRTRLPAFEDMEDLPFVQAIILEILRWRPVAPVGIPHCSSRDDVYNDYLIPKGTICIPNIWSINYDSQRFGENASDFFPERHLDSSGRLRDSDSAQPIHVSFGFGRRACPGRPLAESSLFVFIATLLWSFEMKPFGDFAGNPKVPIEEHLLDEGLLISPKDFKCQFVPRINDLKDILDSVVHDD